MADGVDEGSAAMRGSVSEPLAWFVDGVGYPYATVIRERAQAWADSDGGVIVPLYRSPTLFDAERVAVEDCLEWAMVADDRNLAAVLRSLLERLK